ncbi:MAG: tyrosine-type recombinase/integrase, partial [Planctomycetes bacterium]|nr:tyrosine-type recombinase/integrase [Planctomycetota bacterium]
PRALRPAEEERLLEALRAADGAEADRDRVLIELMLATGVRLSSALALAVEDVDLERGTLLLREVKGGRQERVILGAQARQLLRDFLADRTSGPVFRAKAGTRITARHAQRRFRHWREQAGIQENRAGFEKMGDRFDGVNRKLDMLGPDPHSVKAHTEAATKELSIIRKRRSLDADGSRERSRILAQRVTEGDLCHADFSIRVDVLNWAARLHAARAETLPTAKSYLGQIQFIDTAADTLIAEALILEFEEETADGALQILRDIDNPDGRSTFFLFLSRARGETVALEWFDQHLPFPNAFRPCSRKAHRFQFQGICDPAFLQRLTSFPSREMDRE